jgi:serine/threonine protein kinase
MTNLVGKTLKNRYKIVESLGRGGMAEVYKVWDTQRGVPLAMKVLRDDLAEDIVFMLRFEREAHNLTKLQHPNIVRCYGLEREGRTAFMLMDYIEGGTLRSEIFDAHAPLALQRILAIMQPVCSALYYAHQMGMVHCDVKSANIMIHKNGTVYLTDFGIARGMDAGTSTMVGMGTPAYMAPELIKGQDPTAQTDIYALGIVLYEMLTGGERPFTGERATITGTTAEKVRWEHVQMPPKPMLKYNARVNAQLEGVVQRCLKKNAHDRYRNVLDLFSSLDEAIQNTKNKQLLSARMAINGAKQSTSHSMDQRINQVQTKGKTENRKIDQKGYTQDLSKVVQNGLESFSIYLKEILATCKQKRNVILMVIAANILFLFLWYLTYSDFFYITLILTRAFFFSLAFYLSYEKFKDKNFLILFTIIYTVLVLIADRLPSLPSLISSFFFYGFIPGGILSYFYWKKTPDFNKNDSIIIMIQSWLPVWLVSALLNGIDFFYWGSESTWLIYFIKTAISFSLYESLRMSALFWWFDRKNKEIEQKY